MGIQKRSLYWTYDRKLEESNWPQHGSRDRIRGLAFDSISHYVLLQKLQADRHQVTFLFSLFYNDLPDIVSDCDGGLHMYADDTTIYVIVIVLILTR